MTGQVLLQATGAGGIARLTLSHPGKHNAMDVAMWRALRAHAQALAGDARLRVLVVAGDGAHFASGGDIAEFPQFRFAPDTLEAFHEEVVAPALEALLALDAPIVAAIRGSCVGGGLEIAACCDLRLADATARFGAPIARLGFPMAPREVEIVARAVGDAVLREWLIDAQLWTAEQALARGVLTRVVAAEALEAEVAATAARIAALSPQALRLCKQALRQVGGSASGRDARRAAYAYAASSEHREGIAAFIARRAPQFGDKP